MRDYLGDRITKQKANALLDTNQKLTDRVIRALIKKLIDNNHDEIEKIQQGLADKAKTFYDNTFNAFVFSKDDIFRFLFGDPDDPNHKPPTAEYLMVLLGAHPSNDTPFKIGEPTVIIAGCNDVSPNHDRTIFKTLTLNQPAAEHPQRYYKINIDSFKDESEVIIVEL